MDCITPEKLNRLWALYTKDRSPYVSPTTIGRDYSKIRKRLDRLPSWVTSSGDVLEWLRNNYSHEISRRTLQQIKACCEWAVARRHLTQDPFASIANLPDQGSKGITSPASYTSQESKAILRAFQGQHPLDQRWAAALLHTGARPEELRALRVRHWTPQKNTLCFEEAYPMDAAVPQRTKNGMVTPDFPAPEALAPILNTAARNGRPDRWLFLGHGKGDRPFDYTRFQQFVWKPTMESLAANGTIAHVLSQYHARHSWITRQVDAGLSIQDVAYLSRTSPKIILSTYAQRSRSIKIAGL